MFRTGRGEFDGSQDSARKKGQAANQDDSVTAVCPTFVRLRANSYCLLVVDENEPGVGLLIKEFPWNELIVPLFNDKPVAFCPITLSETFRVEPLLA